MRILVTGGRGMLGTDISARLQVDRHEVIATGSAEFNVSDPVATVDAVKAINPDVVIHTAAWTDVDGCEQYPDKAISINALGSANIATACQKIGAELIAISTDFVFDGKKSAAYDEFDLPNPLGVYGRSKLLGEQWIEKICPRHKIARVSWLFGRHGKCFPKSILNAAKTRPELRVVNDQIGSPTFTKDAADTIAHLLTVPTYGIFHISNSGQCSWHEFAIELLKLAGMDSIPVTPISSGEWPTSTKRPEYSVLRNYIHELIGAQPMRHWKDAAADYVHDLREAGQL